MTTDRLDGAAVAVLRVGTGPDRVGAALCAAGASATTIRVSAVVDRADAEVLDAVGELDRFAWVAVTSANAARRLSLWATRWPLATRIAAVGPATSAAVTALGLTCAAVAQKGTATSLSDAIDDGPVLFLAAAAARDDLVAALGARGLEVTTVVAYDLVARALVDAEVDALAHADVIVAMSPSAVDALDLITGEARDRVRDVPLVVIGPTTAARAAARTWHVAQVAAARDPGSVTAAVLVAVRG